MQFITQASKLPETSIHPILGHGGLTLKQMQNNNRIRHGWELLVPSVRKRNKVYYEGLRDHSRERAGEYIARLHGGLRRNYSMQQNANLKLFIAGEKCEDRIPGFSFSDISAFATVDAELTENKREQVRWGIFVVNAYYDTSNLIHVTTSTDGSSEGSLDNIEVFDTGKGDSFTPADYTLEGEAQLYQTVTHIIDRLDFAVNHAPSRVAVTQLD